MSWVKGFWLRVFFLALWAMSPLQAALVSAGPVQLPQTGQQLCWNAEGAVISCSGSGQDGDLTTGAPWSASRFTEQGQTITDTLTGLMWTKDANAPGAAVCETGVPKTWQAAIIHVKCLNESSFLGYNDWRLPNVRELRSLINYGQAAPSAWLKTSPGFANVQEDFYWSSSSFALSLKNAWSVGFWVGRGEARDKSDNLYIWPVRAGR